MELPPQESVTGLLLRWSAGDRECLNRLLPLLEDELRCIAHRLLRKERRDHTLDATALVNEAYLRLVDQQPVDWQNRAQFLAIAARLMRQILVDHARELSRDKRGGTMHMLPLDGELIISEERSRALVALDDALSALAAFDGRKARIIELRYFGGMTVEETAEAIGVHPNTVIRDWRLAKVWLRRELRPHKENVR